MHDDEDIEGRISRLEAELAQLRGHANARPRRARRLDVILAMGLFAAGLPVATWLHLRAEDEASVAAAKAEYKLERRLQGYHHKQERNMRFIDAALAPGASDDERARALRFLIDGLGKRSVTRKWAQTELAAIEARTGAGASASMPQPLPCRARH